MLTRDEILDAEDLKRETVDVPEWGGEVTVQEMSGAQRDAYEVHITSTPEDTRPTVVRARLAAFSIVDEEGELIFTIDDITKLAKKSAKALDRVFTVAASMSMLGEKEVQDAEGN